MNGGLIVAEKRFNVFDVDGTIFLEDHKEGSYHIGQIGNVDVNCLNDIADRLNELNNENKQLKNKLQTYKTGNVLLKTTLNKYKNENQQIRNTITEMYNNERTYIGKSTLKQLLEQIQ